MTHRAPARPHPAQTGRERRRQQSPPGRAMPYRPQCHRGSLATLSAPEFLCGAHLIPEATSASVEEDVRVPPELRGPYKQL